MNDKSVFHQTKRKIRNMQPEHSAEGTFCPNMQKSLKKLFTNGITRISLRTYVYIPALGKISGFLDEPSFRSLSEGR